MDAYRVWADVDLDALAANLGVIRARAGTSVAVMLVVKADAYGHGAVGIAHHALRCGVRALGVGTSTEALELRAAGIRAPILILGTILDEEAPALLMHAVEIGVHSADRCRMLEELGRRRGHRARVHLNIDTGMGRLGVLPERAIDVLAQIRASEHLELAGIMTHASAPSGFRDPHTSAQFAAFERVLARARELDLARGWIHAANSACLFTAPRKLYDAVRPGIAAYGILPGGLQGDNELRPVLSLKTRVVFLKDLPTGAPVGYGQTWRAPRPSRIATLPIGYNDGLRWHLGNRGEVLVRGRRAPIVGNVSMDYTTIDVTDVPDVSVNDEVTVVGEQGGARIDIAEVAAWAGTIPYEITCAVGKRVTRICRGGETIPAALPSVEPVPRLGLR